MPTRIAIVLSAKVLAFCSARLGPLCSNNRFWCSLAWWWDPSIQNDLALPNGSAPPDNFDPPRLLLLRCSLAVSETYCNFSLKFVVLLPTCLPACCCRLPRCCWLPRCCLLLLLLLGCGHFAKHSSGHSETVEVCISAQLSGLQRVYNHVAAERAQICQADASR